MLISNKYKFIFIHNYKVAGSSISNSLIKYAAMNPANNHFGITISENNTFLGKTYRQICKMLGKPCFESHDSALKIMDKVGYYVWNNFFKFGFVRNPWDWQVSLYHYMLQDKNHHQHELIKKMESFD